MQEAIDAVMLNNNVPLLWMGILMKQDEVLNALVKEGDRS